MKYQLENLKQIEDFKKVLAYAIDYNQETKQYEYIAYTEQGEIVFATAKNTMGINFLDWELPSIVGEVNLESFEYVNGGFGAINKDLLKGFTSVVEEKEPNTAFIYAVFEKKVIPLSWTKLKKAPRELEVLNRKFGINKQTNDNEKE